jgi:hypothetical protein
MATHYEEAWQQELIRAFRLDAIDPEKREAFLKRATEVLQKRIFVETMEKLGEIGVAEYQKLLEHRTDADAGDVEAFLNGKIPEYRDFAANVTMNFVKDMLADKREDEE